MESVGGSGTSTSFSAAVDVVPWTPGVVDAVLKKAMVCGESELQLVKDVNTIKARRLTQVTSAAR